MQVLYDVAGEDPTREDVLDRVTQNKDACVSGLQQVLGWVRLAERPGCCCMLRVWYALEQHCGAMGRTSLQILVAAQQTADVQANA